MTTRGAIDTFAAISLFLGLIGCVDKTSARCTEKGCPNAGAALDGSAGTSSGTDSGANDALGVAGGSGAGPAGTTGGTGSGATDALGVAGGSGAGPAGTTGGTGSGATDALGVAGGSFLNPTSESEFVCTMYETTEVLAPLPPDTNTYRSMSYELCFNDRCANLLAGSEASSYIALRGGVGQTIDVPTRDLRIDVTFWFQQIPCITDCATPRYRMRATASADPNSKLVDGDVWKLTILNTDGSVFYESSTVAVYQLSQFTGLGDFTNLHAACKTLSVPMSP